MNKIYNEDCRITLDRELEYDYIFCVPPDFNELNMNPNKNMEDYYQFLRGIFDKFKAKNNVVTIAITDRKYKGGIIPKHMEIISSMNNMEYLYLSQKIWCKSYKQNLYRLNYSHIMSFNNGKVKQNHNPSYEEDVWNAKVYKHQGYNYAIALEVVKRCIANFTKENDVVYDPFMGSGTTAIACLELNRKYIGSELDSVVYMIAEHRIKRYYDRNENLFSKNYLP